MLKYSGARRLMPPFFKLKHLFTFAPVLVHPDPLWQLMVEVVDFDTGVGAVISQWHALDNKLHSCAFFSWRLSRNYDLGKWELLAVNLALGEWRQWPEGTEQPFVVWTDHKNLANITLARSLGSILQPLQLYPTYHPCSRNTKPDTLSQQFSSVDLAPDPILPASPVVSPIIWENDIQIQNTLQTQPEPGGGHPYVPDTALQWIHASRFSYHPRINQTLSLVKHHSWWPYVDQDTRSYVKACTVYTWEVL